MFHLVTGGSGSGKSAYAENLITEYKENHSDVQAYYIATMQPFGKEAEERISRHRNMREGKGFETIECTENLEECLRDFWMTPQKRVVLLECMSNLVANEMFNDEVEDGQAVPKVMRGIRYLLEYSECLVVVTNEVFSESTDGTIEMKKYKEDLGTINCKMAEAADTVTEVVYGIPVRIK